MSTSFVMAVCTGEYATRCSQLAKTLCLLLVITFISACATTPYQYGSGRAELDAGKYPKPKQQILQGKPNRFLDASGWIWPGSLLAKLILWNKKVDSHQISPETVASIEKYLQDNELHDVQVLVNNYRPGNQWQRLFKNKSVSGGWRYTLGIISVVRYTIMPGRFFGGDAFNPYTYTLYLYSDDPAIALHEGGHAKDFSKRKNKGNYAALYQIPFVPLYHEYQATKDAVSYLQDQGQTEEQAEAYVSLYPAYATYVTAPFLFFGNHSAGDALLLQSVGTIPGHITGRVKASRLRNKAKAQSNSSPSSSETDSSINAPASSEITSKDEKKGSLEDSVDSSL